MSLIPVANLPPVSLLPAANLPPVSLIPVANLPPVSLIPVVCRYRIRIHEFFTADVHGSGKKMRIHSDLDPQHWCNLYVKAFDIFMYVVNVIQKQYVSLSTCLSFYGIFVRR